MENKNLVINTLSSGELVAAAEFYFDKAKRKNTHKAYKEGLKKFIGMGFSIPATPDEVIAFLVASIYRNESEPYAMNTLNLWLAAISFAHRRAGHPNPTQHPNVIAVMSGIVEEHGKQPQRVKPLVKSDIMAIINVIRTTDQSLRATRDIAMIMLGFTGALRASEIIGLNVQDLEFNNKGILINIKQTKTKTKAEGHEVGIPFGRGNTCPVKAVRQWLHDAEINDGRVFRSITSGGNPRDSIGYTGFIWSLKQRVTAANIDPDWIGCHSLRAGFVTTAIDANKDQRAIQQQGGWANSAMLDIYYRRNRAFEINLW
jgi:integrase